MENSQSSNYNEGLKNIPGKFREKISLDLELVSVNGKSYQDVFVYEYNGEIRCYTNDGENVFLMEPENNSQKKGFKVDDGAESFSFKEIDGKYLLEVGLIGGTYYFLENGKNYIPETPKTSGEKFEEFLDNYLKVSEKLKQDILNVLYTEEVEKFGYVISDNLEKVQNKIVGLLKSSINYGFDKIATGVDLNLYRKPGKKYQETKHKKNR